MLIDCDTCQARGDACADCVVSVMLGMPGMPALPPTVDVDEVRAIKVLAESGLVPPLRLVTAPPGSTGAPKAAPGGSDQQAM